MTTIVITIVSKKYGVVEALVDEQDFIKLRGYCFYVWGTPPTRGTLFDGVHPWK